MQAPAAFIAAMQRLASLNLARTAPSRIEELLLYSHPSISRRIERAERVAVTMRAADVTASA